MRPINYVIIIHTAGTTECFEFKECSQRVRSIQGREIEELGLDDISYNFLVGGDGNVYEGRGWNFVGQHTQNYNDNSIGIAIIGNFNYQLPNEEQIEAVQQLMEYGVKIGKIRKDYKLLGQKQCLLRNNDDNNSPGQMLFNLIKTWDHWSPIPWTYLT